MDREMSAQLGGHQNNRERKNQPWDRIVVAGGSLLGGKCRPCRQPPHASE